MCRVISGVAVRVDEATVKVYTLRHHDSHEAIRMEFGLGDTSLLHRFQTPVELVPVGDVDLRDTSWWTFEFDEVVPEDIRRVTMTPIVDVAQVGFFANGAQYAEGAVVLTDPDGADIGRGFAESVSYADTRRTAHRLAGLPESQAHLDSLSHLTTPPALAVLNAAYVLAHKAELDEVISESVGLEYFVRSPDPAG